MFERKIYNDIVSWHESLKIKKRALIIKGLRQIGKTTIVRKFCEEHYENTSPRIQFIPAKRFFSASGDTPCSRRA